jgi:hypothetical protein
MFRAAQFLYTLDSNRTRPRAVHAATHHVEELSEVDDFGLTRRVFNSRCAIG